MNMLKVWWDIYSQLYCKFTTESVDERNVKIGYHLAKLVARGQEFK